MKKEYVCPFCENRGPRFVGIYISGNGKRRRVRQIQIIKYQCHGCGKTFELPDVGFGYLPMRVARLHELYP